MKKPTKRYRIVETADGIYVKRLYIKKKLFGGEYEVWKKEQHEIQLGYDFPPHCIDKKFDSVFTAENYIKDTVKYEEKVEAGETIHSEFNGKKFMRYNSEAKQ